jgi:hypothetical protein
VAGEDVILAHRLLKNSIQKDEYLLLTDEFHRLSGDVEGMVSEQRKEECEGLGTVDVNVYYLPERTTASPVMKRTLWEKLKITAKTDSYLIQRLLGKSAKRFRNLDEACGEDVQSTTHS